MPNSSKIIFQVIFQHIRRMLQKIYKGFKNLLPNEKTNIGNYYHSRKIMGLYVSERINLFQTIKKIKNAN